MLPATIRPLYTMVDHGIPLYTMKKSSEVFCVVSGSFPIEATIQKLNTKTTKHLLSHFAEGGWKGFKECNALTE